MNIDTVHKRIDRQRRAWFAAALANAAARWLTAALLATIAVFLADWLVLRRAAETDTEDLHGRIALLAVFLAFLAWRGWRLFGAVYKAREDENGIALRIEDHCPEFEGRLISSVQLSRAAGEDRYVGSPELIEAVEQQALELSESVSFAGIVDTRPTRRAIATLCLLALPMAVVAVTRHETSAAFLQRLFLRRAAYPAATRLVAIEVPERVPVGEPFTVTAVVDSRGVVPRQSRLQVKKASDEGTFLLPMPQERAPADAGQHRFSAVIENPTEDLDVRVIAFDARSGWRRVRVLSRPSVLQVRLRYTFPDYTGLPPKESAQGDIRAVTGTRVALAAHADKAIRHATLAFRPGTGSGRTTDLSVHPDGTRLDGELLINANGVYTIHIEDTDGLANATPPEWSIEALVDQAPTVRVVFPEQDTMVTPTARWPMRFSAKDDFGLGRARFCYEVQDPLQTEPIDSGKRELGQVSTNEICRATSLRSWIDVSALAVLPGQQLHYWIEVTDGRVPEPNAGRSRTHSFDVVDAQSARDSLKSARDTAIKQLGALVHSEEAGRVYVDRIRRTLRREKKQ